MRHGSRLGGRLAPALLAMVLAAPTLAADHDPPEAASVLVQANMFEPEEVEVAREGTVTWQVAEDGHTIVADDGRFEFRGEGGGGVPAGSTREFTVGTDDEVIRYHCTIHGGPGGQGMSGVIVVGHPEAPVADTPVVRVPEDVGSIAEAVATVPAWGRVEVAPGVYRVEDPVLVEREGITVTGTGTDPWDVYITYGRDLPDSAFALVGSHQTLANLTVGPMRNVGVVVRGADAASLASVVIDGRGSVTDGVRVEDTTGTSVLDSRIRDVRRGGVRIEPCPACGVRIARTEVTGSLAGVLATGARGVQVTDSRLRGNAVGIVARSAAERSSTVTVRDSVIDDNDRRDVLPDPTDLDRRLAVGAGVWLAGVTDSVIEGNTIGGHGYGIVLAGGAATSTTVRGNTIDRSADADLAWNGLGGDVCFEDNGADVTSEPPDAQSLYPCDRPTVGVAYPVVDLRLLQRAYS